MYGYPIEDAAKIAVREVREFLSPAESAEDAEEGEPQSGRAQSPSASPQDGRSGAPRPPMEVIICCFSAHDAAVYERLLS